MLSLCKIIKRPQLNENCSKEISLRIFDIRTLKKTNQINETDEQEPQKEIPEEIVQSNSILLEAQKRAGEIIFEAEKRAASIINNAQEESQRQLEDALNKAYQEGFNQGRQEGFKKALTEAEAEAEQIRRQAVDVLNQTEQERLAAIKELENDLVKISVQIAEKIVSAQLSVEQNTINNIVQEALQMVANRETINVFINPADADVVRQQQKTLSDKFSDDLKLRVICDTSINQGGCRIETEQGWIDASIESKFKEIKKSLGLLPQ